MKILLLAEVSAERVIGGAERVLRQQAVGLVAAGHQVDLLTRATDETVSMKVSISEKATISSKSAVIRLRVMP